MDITLSPITVIPIEETENKVLTEVQQIIFPHRKKHFEIKQFYERSFGSNRYVRYDGYERLPSLINHMLEYCYTYLDSHSITNYNRSNHCIEFHQRNCSNEKQVKAPFGWHQDDNGAVSYKTHSFLFYMRKDSTVRGGNLDYKIGNQIHTHIVEPQTILYFTGDLWHIPQQSEGFGCRDITVIFIPRI
jgi:hypothetical protein